ncbi:MAG: polysaccharide deacetylase family protein [Deltaproteobacteria bacterium]|nr:polysaccharide deacetylase family protein [Deltaproteobacteria bacterium]
MNGRDSRRDYAVKSLSRYWPRMEEVVAALPIPQVDFDSEWSWPPRGVEVSLPEWAADLGVRGRLLVPAQAVLSGDDPAWRRTDWLMAAFWYLTGAGERRVEQLHGPIHSYASRLRGWDKRFWNRAWVNRMALFLRRWAAREKGMDEIALFGLLPETEIILTHDVDAVAKTMALRGKGTVWLCLRVLPGLAMNDRTRFLSLGRQAADFFTSRANYWCFDQIKELEDPAGVRSHFNFYGGPGGWKRTPRQWLLDPGYSVFDRDVQSEIKELHQGGWTIGLHQSFAAWNQAGPMAEEKTRVEEALGAPVVGCRQHWLRFSWMTTWKAQQEAGLCLDTTLGFNDQPGFRNGAALCFHPWDQAEGRPLAMEALPMVLMDSHLYGHDVTNEEERMARMKYWIDEVRLVRGTATINWHQHTMSPDYGWAEGYQRLLELITG